MPAAGLVRLRHRARPLAGRGRLPSCARLYRGWPFFRALVDNLEMTLAKSSLEIARGYLELVPAEPSRERLFAAIEAEHERTRRAVLGDRRGRRSCSTGSRSLQRSIAPAQPVRRPDERDPGRAAAPLPRRRRRRGARAGAPPLLRSIAGIAAALRNTG